MVDIMAKRKMQTILWVGWMMAGLLAIGGCFHVDEPPVAAFGYAPTSPYAGEQTTFDASASHDPDADDGAGIESYEWSFGDGKTGGGATVTHVYAASGTYEVTLTVTDATGLTATATDTVTVAEPAANPPVAAISYDPVAPEIGEVIAFSAAESYDPARISPRSIVSYSWSFGDGTTAQGSSVTHAYSDAGSYVVTLSVEDDEGGHGTAYATVRVTDPAGGNTAPVAAFTYSPPSPLIDQQVTFAADQSYDPAALGPKSIVVYAWDFGDGETAVGETVVHAFADAGTYTVALTVSDDDGASDTATQSVTVLDIVIPPPPPPPGG